MIEPGQLWSMLRRDGLGVRTFLTLSSPEPNDHGYHQVLVLKLDSMKTLRVNANSFLNPKSWRREA